jgi:hypothetical protein
LGPDFLAFYWSAGFGTFLQVSALASHWLKDYANFTQAPEENDQYSVNTQYISKPIHFYQLIITKFFCGKYKNKPLTLFSQRKLALTAKNTLFAL